MRGVVFNGYRTRLKRGVVDLVVGSESMNCRRDVSGSRGTAIRSSIREDMCSYTGQVLLSAAYTQKIPIFFSRILLLRGWITHVWMTVMFLATQYAVYSVI